jgi:hypothetical protein
MAWQPLSAAGPLERAIAREASRLARESDGESDRSPWQAMSHLEPGSRIVVETADALVTGAFESIDATTIVLSRDGTVQRVNSDQVLMIERRVRRGSAVAAALGAIGGLWLGSGLAVGIGLEVQCRPNCGGIGAAMAGLVIGLPIVAGYGAWRGTSRMAEEVVYRRPLQPLSRGDVTLNNCCQRWRLAGGRSVRPLRGRWPSELGDVVRHVLLFERHQRCVHQRVDRQMPFAAAQPRSRIVRATQRSDGQGQRVNAELQLFAIAAFQDFEVHRHTVE